MAWNGEQRAFVFKINFKKWRLILRLISLSGDTQRFTWFICFLIYHIEIGGDSGVSNQVVGDEKMKT